ncbi:MAG: ATP-dependent helicase [Cetobacterium sp.]|uniref:ATP-dependent helicase n=1 Tax=Cetobacterium sp. TaxID=2071632 RepID=UPI003F3AB420
MKKNYLKNECLNFCNINNIFKEFLISNLNFEQLIAVTNLNGNFLLLAGAGSGKTRVIIYRTLLLLKLQTKPEKILILTFTRKACNEIKKRIETFIPNSNVNIETFHSLAYKILRKYTQNKTFQVLTMDSALSLAKQSFFFNEISNVISKEEIIKATISSRTHYFNSDFFKNLETHSKKIILNFLETIDLLKKNQNLYSFDDLLSQLYNFLKLNIIPISFEYIMVDEYQDTDNLQIEILKLLSQKSYLMAVGDDYQSIYSFKGATIDNIINFSNDFENTKIFLLKENYRSSNHILKLSNEFSKKLRNSFRKTLLCNNTSNELPSLNIFKTHTEEVKAIYNKIKVILNNTPDASISILFRNFSYMQEFVNIFDHYKLSYNISQNIFLENIFKDRTVNDNTNLALLTIHSSKGLEWDYVFLPLLLDGIIPTSIGNPINLEEEKRLFYVALTRAKKELFLSYPLSFYNNYGLFLTPTPFINDINSSFFQIKRG